MESTLGYRRHFRACICIYNRIFPLQSFREKKRKFIPRVNNNNNVVFRSDFLFEIYVYPNGKKEEKKHVMRDFAGRNFIKTCGDCFSDLCVVVL